MIVSDPLPSLHNHPTEDEPDILLDKERNIFRFSGKSMPEDPGKVYNPILAWVSAYVKDPNAVTRIEFKMDYYNSSTARYFVEILELFEELYENGQDIKIIWWYQPDDVVMHERGEDIEAVIEIPIEFRQFE